MIEALIGDTLQITWVSSGSTANPINYAVYNGSETLVDSASMTDSGNGHYYGLHTIPSSVGFYSVYTEATVSGKPYRRYTNYKAVKGEV